MVLPPVISKLSCLEAPIAIFLGLRDSHASPLAGNHHSPPLPVGCCPWSLACKAFASLAPAYLSSLSLFWSTSWAFCPCCTHCALLLCTTVCILPFPGMCSPSYPTNSPSWARCAANIPPGSACSCCLGCLILTVSFATPHCHYLFMLLALPLDRLWAPWSQELILILLITQLTSTELTGTEEMLKKCLWN